MFTRLSRGHKVGSSGAAVALLCFFLPWVLVSCNDQPVASFSGWQLAAGTTVGSGFATSQLPGTPILFLVLLAGIAALVLAYLAMRRGRLTKLDSFGPIGLGGVTLLVLFGQLNSTQSGAAQQGATASFQYGLLGVVLGYLAVIAGGIMNLRPVLPITVAQGVEGSVATSGSTQPTIMLPRLADLPPNYQVGRLNFDLTTLRKAARIPLVVAAGLGLILLINASLGSFWSLAFTLAWAFAGLSYTRAAFTTGANMRPFDLAVNGGALSAAVALGYQLLAQIIFGIQKRNSSFDIISLVATLIEAFVIGALAAVAWYAYQQPVGVLTHQQEVPQPVEPLAANEQMNK